MSRGRHAEKPTDIPAKGWVNVAPRVKSEMASDHADLIAAGVAFYTLLAIFPALTALLAIGGLLVESTQIVDELQTLTSIMHQRSQQSSYRRRRMSQARARAALGWRQFWALCSRSIRHPRASEA